MAAEKPKKTQPRMIAARITGAARTKPTPVRMAWKKCSFGRRDLSGRRRQARSATITATKETALSAKFASAPSAAMVKPPSAGPTARVRLKPMPFSTIAWVRSFRGTSSGVVAAQPGKFIAVPAPIAKVSAISPQGPSSPA
jgi:hypothetical protein